jgi:hypothetical protein
VPTLPVERYPRGPRGESGRFDPDYAGQYRSVRQVSQIAVDFDAGNCQAVQLANGANNLTVANAKPGARYVLELHQPDNGAAGTISWPASIRFSDGTPPPLSPTNGRADLLTLYCVSPTVLVAALLPNLNLAP